MERKASKVQNYQNPLCSGTNKHSNLQHAASHSFKSTLTKRHCKYLNKSFGFHWKAFYGGRIDAICREY